MNDHENGSRVVTTNQAGPHQQLHNQVQRHLSHPFQRPIAEHSRAAFAQAQAFVAGRPIVLDGYCGVGESTARLAERHPDCAVIGVDKSLHRLSKHDHHRSAPVENYLLLRADLDDFWRLALDAGWQLQHHYLLYPNPWPKSAHFGRRVHGSALFPVVLALGGTLELRSNWALYLQEFAEACAVAGVVAHCQALAEEAQPLTPFERKYRQSGQPLWQLRATLPAGLTFPAIIDAPSLREAE